MLHLAFLSFIRRPLTRLILLFLIALACALPVFLLQTAGGLYDGINRAVSPFPILVGAKGSSYQLVLNTVFLRDKPIGNITHDDMEKLASDPHTEAVYPLAFGDNYRGFRIAGTNADIFDFRPDKKKGPWLSIAEGRCFAEEGDVVIGSETARLTGLRIGDTFHSVHGASVKGRAHQHTLKVVGILVPVKGPYDTAILTDIRDVWESHGAAAEAQKEVTALLVVPKGYKEAMQLLSSYQRQKDVQMLFPSQTIISLYAMVGQTKDFWEILTAGLLAVSILITLLAMYWSTLGRLSELALLRALGAGKGDIRRLLLAEAAILLLAGSFAGWLLGYGGGVLTAKLIASHAAVVMETAPDPRGLLIIPFMTAVGTLAALIPAWLIQRKDVVGDLG